jgi:Undecaprenyl-phosphate galactose phosphotransferase WbaP
MSSITVVNPVYSGRDFKTTATNWLTYASIPAADLFTLILTGALAQALYYFFMGQFSPVDGLRFVPLVLIFYAAFCMAGLYPGLPNNPIEEFRQILRALSLSFLVIVGGTFLMRDTSTISRLFVVLCWLMACVTVPLSRYAVRLWCSQQSWWGIPTVILGEAELGSGILSVLQANRGSGLRPIALLVDQHFPEPSSAADSHGIYRGLISQADFFARRHPDCYAILAASLMNSERVKAIFAEHAHHYRRVFVIPDLFGVASQSVRAKELHGLLGIEIDHHLTRTSPQIYKRLFDVLVCIALAAILSPVLLLVALAVKTTSPGPILYWQRRIGRDGKGFRIWKFRTMVVDADKVLEKHLEADCSLREEWNRDHKLRKDPRSTVMGRLLRRTSLDELPQLWNIFCGEMSLVGPRPIREPEVAKYGAIFDQYTRVVPGLTGMWQISGRNDTTYEKRTQLDEYYIRNWSISLDLYILLRTVKTIILAEGAY